MASFPNASARASCGHGKLGPGETALLFLFAASITMLVAFLLYGQSAQKAEPQRYTVVCGLRC